MNKKRIASFLLAGAMLVATPLTAFAGSNVYRDENNNVFYKPEEQGVYSKGGYTIEKISNPTIGPEGIDGILTGDEADRGNSYSWSMAEYGDYVYIGTCYNSTYYIFHDRFKKILQGFQSSGIISADVNVNQTADDLVTVMFGKDTFDKTQMNDWTPVIMSVHKVTGEAKVVFRERDVWAENPDIFPGYSAAMATKNYLSGYRMAFEFNGKLYFAGAGNPTATLVEVDPETNTGKVAFYNTNKKNTNVACGVHGLITYDDEILMCLATDDYDGNGNPGGIIVASSDPTAGLENWRVIADQDDFDGLPAIMKTDGLNGGGVWDIIEYNGSLYVTIVTDKTVNGVTNKQGFAMYRGDKNADGSFNWTQVIGGNEESKYDFGLGIDISMTCNLWTYDGYLYLGTYNDPMLDLAAITVNGNFEQVYNDLDHSIYLYRMDKNGNFEQIGGKNDNPYFKTVKGNLGAGLGDVGNQYVWRMEEHNGELYIGTYDIGTLLTNITQLTDGKFAGMEYEELSGKVEGLKSAAVAILGLEENSTLVKILDKTIFSKFSTDLLQQISGFATGMSAGKDPVPEYRQMVKDYEAKKAEVYAGVERVFGSRSFATEYAEMTGMQARAITPDYLAGVKADIYAKLDKVFAAYDELVYNTALKSFVYYFGVSSFAKDSVEGSDLLVSKDGVNFDVITRDGFGSEANHGFRTICSTEYGVFVGTANPYNGTQLWLMSSDRDKDRVLEEDDNKDDDNQGGNENEGGNGNQGGNENEGGNGNQGGNENEGGNGNQGGNTDDSENLLEEVKPEEVAPETGDNANMVLPVVAMLVSGGAVVYFAKRRKQNN